MSRFPLHGLLLLLPLLVLPGCPPTNSKPCDTDAECGAEGRCRRGACGPVCLDDTECGTSQICRAGSCIATPECQADTDCAQGFICRADRCSCTVDSACAANQICQSGACVTRPRCTSDNDCSAIGRKCELTQGLCIPLCNVSTDCAPGVDPRIAVALYQCLEGSCLRRCLNDQTCGPNLICTDGSCRQTECKTYSDCKAGEYCTSATTGRCLTYTTCTSDAQCDPNFSCRAFSAQSCPPGFPCSQKICQELPRCFTDGDCRGTNPAQPAAPAFCADQHCQPTTSCSSSATCANGKACIGGICVPSLCRGHPDCPQGQFCVDGACAAPPQNAEVSQTTLTPTRAWLAVGSTQQFQLVGFKFGGQSSPLTDVTWTVTDPGGGATSSATISSSGLLTGAAAGTVLVKAALAGGSVPAQTATVTVIAPPSSGRTIYAVDSSTREPIAGVTIVGCDAPPSSGACPNKVTQLTDAQGAATFAFTGATASFDLASSAVRVGDGLPQYERVSLLDVTGNLFVVPLAPNPVHGNSGFVSSLNFGSVHTSGNYWAGFVVMSLGNPIDADLNQLLGEQFQTTVPGVNQKVPVPGSVVAYTSIGFGIPTEVKSTSYGLGQAGRRSAIGFAGKAQQDQLLTLRSTDLLAYAGALDFALQTYVQANHFARVPDTQDLDNDGLCASAQQCPQGTEDLPDYAQFAHLSLTPDHTQALRTEVVPANLPAGVNTVVVAASELSADTGLLPLGLSSSGGGAPTADGSRPVQPILLKSGAPYAGLEAGLPGIWALGISVNPQGAQTARSNATGRFFKGAALPTKVSLAPFLPFVSGSALVPGTFSPGQPSWSDLVSAGADMAKLVVSGTQNRHVVYVPMVSPATSVRLADPASGAGADPVSEANAQLEVQALDLPTTLSAQDALDAPSPSLLDLPLIIEGYSRSFQ